MIDFALDDKLICSSAYFTFGNPCKFAGKHCISLRIFVHVLTISSLSSSIILVSLFSSWALQKLGKKTIAEVLSVFFVE
ncbi:unnamed protein product [Agarophyton chilense]